MKTMIDRKKLNWSKIEKLPTTNDMLDERYGKEGSSEREAFKKEAYSFYTAQIIEQSRKTVKMTQTERSEQSGSS